MMIKSYWHEIKHDFPVGKLCLGFIITYTLVKAVDFLYVHLSLMMMEIKG